MLVKPRVGDLVGWSQSVAIVESIVDSKCWGHFTSSLGKEQNKRESFLRFEDVEFVVPLEML